MGLRQLLRKRLHISVTLTDPALPNVQASGESGPSVGGWFSANFGVGNLFAVLGLAGTLIGGYTSLRSDLAESKSHQADTDRRLSSLNDRLRTDYVRKDDYDTNNKATDARFHNLEGGQTQIFGHLLSEKH